VAVDNVISVLMDDVVDVGYKLVVAQLDDSKAADLRAGWDVLKAHGADAVVLLGVDRDTGKPIYVAAGDPVAVSAGFDAGAVVRAIALEVEGRGGGKPAMAQGGGENAAGIQRALLAAREMLGIG